MLTIGVKPKTSSDLDVGRRPELKSDEFFCFTPIVQEILRCEHFFTAEKVFRSFTPRADPVIGGAEHPRGPKSAS